MRIATWNINGIRSCAEYLELFMKLTRIDILCIQEVRATKADLEIFRAEHSVKGFSYYFNCGEVPGYAGTAIICRRSLAEANEIKIEKPELGVLDREGRIIGITIRDVSIVCVYSPVSKLPSDLNRENFDLALANYLNSFDDSIIVCGDLNTNDTFLRYSDVEDIESVLNQSKGFERILSSGFHDVWRLFHPYEIGTTWRFCCKGEEHQARLDYILTTDSMIQKISKCEILSRFKGSDHLPVIIELEDF